VKVLFVSSGNSGNISQIIKAQGNSLQKKGICIDYFLIKGNGIKGYLRNIPLLKKKLKKENYDLVHAHFSLTGYVAALSGAKPLVVSLMGWNVKKTTTRHVIKLFERIFWDTTIVKSNDMKNGLAIKNVKVIPNGVDFALFKPIDKLKAQQKIGWNSNKKHILFAANPSRPIKNYALAKSAFNRISNGNIELHLLEDVDHKEVVYYMNGADIVLLTSYDEGSPNVIKEAMACNCQIVTTNVGDVKEIIGQTEGCYISTFNPDDISNKIMLALDRNKKTNGRENIKHLSSEKISEEIVLLYNALKKKTL